MCVVYLVCIAVESIIISSKLLRYVMQDFESELELLQKQREVSEECLRKLLENGMGRAWD